MTPAQHDLAKANAVLKHLRNEAWGLDATPLRKSLIQQWEAQRVAADRRMISELWGERS